MGASPEERSSWMTPSNSAVERSSATLLLPESPLLLMAPEGEDEEGDGGAPPASPITPLEGRKSRSNSATRSTSSMLIPSTSEAERQPRRTKGPPSSSEEE